MHKYKFVSNKPFVWGADGYSPSFDFVSVRGSNRILEVIVVWCYLKWLMQGGGEGRVRSAVPLPNTHNGQMFINFHVSNITDGCYARPTDRFKP